MHTTLAECLRQAQARGLARVDAQILLLHSLQRPLHDRAWLLAHDSDALSPVQEAAWQNALMRRLQGEPVAYITGRKDFFGLTLAVDARVLDPRPDTETLVEWAVDASEDALAVARANASRLNLPVQFIASNWLSAVDVQQTGLFDLIVSNPPYVAEGDPHLAALTHEPLQALTSGPDGLDDIRQIIAQAPTCLAPGAWLLMEHGWDQAAKVQALLRSAGFEQVQSREDLAGIGRCTGARLPS